MSLLHSVRPEGTIWSQCASPYLLHAIHCYSTIHPLYSCIFGSFDISPLEIFFLLCTGFYPPQIKKQKTYNHFSLALFKFYLFSDVFTGYTVKNYTCSPIMCLPTWSIMYFFLHFVICPALIRMKYSRNWLTKPVCSLLFLQCKKTVTQGQHTVNACWMKE